jgi:hypothetical protein
MNAQEGAWGTTGVAPRPSLILLNALDEQIHTGSHETRDPDYLSTARYGPTAA